MMFNLEQLHTIERLQAPVLLLLYWIMYKAELVRPLRGHGFSRWQYWQNLTLNLINFVLIGIFSHLVVTWSYHAMQQQWGVYYTLGLGGISAIVIQIIIYDFLSYGIHRLFHAHNRLWDLHRSHHSDFQMNASTGFRFHPGEGLFRLIIQAMFILLSGMSPYAIVLHSMIAAPIFLISHANYAMPAKLEKILARVFVLPRDHSIHHHPDRRFHDSNYGTIFMFWDHLFGTYTNPADVPEFAVGLHGYDRAESCFDLLNDPNHSRQKA